MKIHGVRDDIGDDLPVIGGHCDGLLYSDDVAFNTQAELDAWREEIKAKLARKKPAGFATWREDRGE